MDTHTGGRFRNVMFGSTLHPENAAVAILVILLFLYIPAPVHDLHSAAGTRGKLISRAECSSANGAEATTMPQFASRLARHVTPEGAGKRRASTGACSGKSLPQDGIIYNNGPVNGTTDAWTINFGYVVSDSFTGGNVTVLTSGYGSFLATL